MVTSNDVAEQVFGLPAAGGELISRATELLSAEYPELIDPTFLYFSPREYLVIFSSPTGTQGFSGRNKHVEIHKFLMAGQIDSYDLESDELVTLPFAMVDTLFLSLELESVRRSTVEFTKLLSRRFRR